MNKTLHDLSWKCTGVLIEFLKSICLEVWWFCIVLSLLFLLKFRFNNNYHRLNKTFEFIITYEYRYSISWCLSSSSKYGSYLILGELIYPWKVGLSGKTWIFIQVWTCIFERCWTCQKFQVITQVVTWKSCCV